MTHDLPQFAELWREQIGPEELSQLQAQAKNIGRNARRRRLFDLVLSSLAIGALCMVLWLNPTSLRVKLGFAPIVAVIIWGVWRRHQITKASQGIALDDPRVFFETAIQNVRDEINFSTISLLLFAPFLVSFVLLVKAAHGIDGVDWMLGHLQDLDFTKLLIIATIVLPNAYFVRENIKLREQLRRLEDMRREWHDRPASARKGSMPD